MNKLRVVIGGLLIAGAVSAMAAGVETKTKDEAEIRALEQRFAAAFRAKDINAILAVYVPDQSLFVFDVVPPRQYVGANAYRKDWENFFASYPGPADFEITDLDIVTDGNLGFSHSIQHPVLTDKDGKQTDLVVRVTDGYRKIKGKWLIVQEHVSVPVDLATGKADLSSKP
jgi:uncharacterized protein (TIGR02246 family)